MKILDAGDNPLSNADVLDWIDRKRAQHATEDADDKARGLKPAARPKNFMRVLDRTERELKSRNYPYVKNPSAYKGDARSTAFQKFAREAEDAMQDSLEAEWRDRLQDMTKEQFDKEFEIEQEKKCLTEPEMLMIYNYAPQCVEMLQPMIENVEDRFTAEEQQQLVDLIVRILRPNETASQEEQSAE
ncbi:Putative RNA polymerase subunit Rpb4/RPC9, HRDC-like superfamily, Rpb4/RPC9 superfamily [Septoria linicola]|uniref:DNA-directed RNA polymerase III subunit RPC9 n=1 Tax=Septoria linicola TaxID=215465 RepID=A0A9Q9EHC5_9PEZI|nr:putative RNA polymerase subunit Rpb4/RPC9, HRDC-like superfamily, Rpb4/RPC9 superfamily [Septoria linicola]USW49173.1 Putative RNA polymerase subunit Rpb4/RPC9, HRDC-like superfamily, Rpb4/RPC9 superfamily [Septoria linicola]